MIELVGAYVLGVLTPVALVVARLVMVGAKPADEEPIYVPARFVSRTDFTEYHTEAEAKRHAQEVQGWQPDGPNDDTWRAGFVVEPDNPDSRT